MTLTEAMLAALASLTAGGGGGALAVHLRSRGATQRAQARTAASVAVAREQGAVGALDVMTSRVQRLEDRLDERDATIEHLRERTDECEQHRDECRGELRTTQAQLGAVARRLGDVLRARGEITGVHEIEEIAASNTPVPGPPPLPREHREIPPPKRGRKDD